MYLLGYEHFRTKDEVESRCRQIIGVTQEGKPVSHWFVPFLHDLFSFHDDWQELAEIITGITSRNRFEFLSSTKRSTLACPTRLVQRA